MRYRLFAACLILAPCGLNAAPPAQTKISGIYSSLNFNQQGGDLTGMELIVLPGPGDKSTWRAVFQLAEGGGPMSALVELLPVSDHYEFGIPADQDVPEMRFSVRFTAKEAVVTNKAANVEEHLRRGRSYWE